MKKIILLLTALLSVNCYSQDSIVTYDFLKDRTTPGNKEYWVHENKPFTFKIKNINLLLYDVVINKETSDFTDEANMNINGSKVSLTNEIKSFSSEFQNFLNQIMQSLQDINNNKEYLKIKYEKDTMELGLVKRKAANERELDRQKQIKQNKVDLYIEQLLKDSLEYLLKKAEISVQMNAITGSTADDIKKREDIDKKARELYIKQVELLSKLEKTRKSLNTSLDSLTNEFLYTSQIDGFDNSLRVKEPVRIIGIKDSIDSYITQIASSLRLYNNIITYYEDLYGLLFNHVQSDKCQEDFIRGRDSVTSSFFPMDTSQVRSKKDPLTQVIEVIFSNKRDLINYTNKLSFKVDELKNALALHTLTDQVNAAADKVNRANNAKKLGKQTPAEPATIEISTLSSTQSQLTSLSKLLTAMLNFDKINELSNEIQKLYKCFDQYTFTASEKEYDLRGIDLLKLNVEIKPNTNLKNVQPIRSEKFTLNVNTYKGIKFDISAGLYFNGMLNDQSYFYNHSTTTDPTGTVLTDSVTIGKKNDPNQYIPFLGSQLNIYWRPWRAHFGAGLTFGLSTNGSDLRYYLGGCLILGKKEKIVLSGGAAAGKVKTLSGQYQENTKYNFKASDFPSSPEVVDAYKFGFYASISFNLMNKKAKGVIDTAKPAATQ